MIRRNNTSSINKTDYIFFGTLLTLITILIYLSFDMEFAKKISLWSLFTQFYTFFKQINFKIITNIQVYILTQHFFSFEIFLFAFQISLLMITIINIIYKGIKYREKKETLDSIGKLIIFPIFFIVTMLTIILFLYILVQFGEIIFYIFSAFFILIMKKNFIAIISVLIFVIIDILIIYIIIESITQSIFKAPFFIMISCLIISISFTLAILLDNALIFDILNYLFIGIIFIIFYICLIIASIHYFGFKISIKNDQ